MTSETDKIHYCLECRESFAPWVIDTLDDEEIYETQRCVKCWENYYNWPQKHE